jgi:hypothetical protein
MNVLHRHFYACEYKALNKKQGKMNDHTKKAKTNQVWDYF